LYGPDRFWLPVGASKELVFLDDEPTCLREHNPKLNGRWSNWFTCLSGVSGEDPVCCQILGENYRQYFVGYYTVVDCSKWTDKKGNSYQYEVKLLPAKMSTINKLKRKKEDRGTLVGCMYKVSRDTDKDPSVGGDFEFSRDADLAKLFDVASYKGKKLSDLYAKATEHAETLNKLVRTFDIKPEKGTHLPKRLAPFNYFEILKPRPAKEIRTMLAGIRFEKDDAELEIPPGAGSGVVASESDDIPF
jgi:hypothetical protein